MSEFETATDEDTPLVTQLRDQLRAANKAVKAGEAELFGYRSEKRTATLAETLKAKGINPKVAKLIPADLAAEELETWIADYADVFGLVEVPAEAPPDDEQLARQRLSSVEAAASPASGDLAQAIAQAKSADEIIAIINSGQRA